MIFVFDLDGTICFNGQPISKKILRSLVNLCNEGHEVIFASARPIRDMLPVIDEHFHHHPMIGGNGSLFAKDKKVVRSNAFSTNELNEIKRLIEQYHATYLIDGEWDYAYTGSDTHPIRQNLDPARIAKMVNIDSLNPIVKVLLLSSDNMEELAEELLKLNVFLNKHRNENVLDISPRGINKWSSLMSLGLKESTFVAFGNDINDLQMFEKALHTVMIGNHEQLFPLAKEVISLNGDYEQKIADKIDELSKKYSKIEI